eukprot:1688757-Pleurochrysis_carterae.AAC.3
MRAPTQSRCATETVAPAPKRRMIGNASMFAGLHRHLFETSLAPNTESSIESAANWVHSRSTRSTLKDASYSCVGPVVSNCSSMCRKPRACSAYLPLVFARPLPAAFPT